MQSTTKQYRNLARPILVVLWIVDVTVQHRWDPIWVSEDPHECLHIDRSLEHEESVSAVVVLELFTFCAEVPWAEYAAVPLSNDPSQVPVAAQRVAMCEVAKITCFYTSMNDCHYERASFF